MKKSQNESTKEIMEKEIFKKNDVLRRLERIVSQMKYWHKELEDGLNIGTAIAIVEDEINLIKGK